MNLSQDKKLMGIIDLIEFLLALLFIIKKL